MSEHESRGRARWPRRVKTLAAAARNAADVFRNGRLGAPYSAPFEVARHDRVCKLRHYRAEEPAPRADDADAAGDDGAALEPGPILLVPPLMVASEVYDIAPELSAVHFLLDAGLDVWLTDFGAPEEIEGGMERTLDDHVLAVARSVRAVHEATGRPVHLAGYSQGGMFCYQAAAYLRSEGLASVVTFGSPVDIHRNMPGMAKQAAGRLIGLSKKMIEGPLEMIEGLPGFLSSTGFKLMSPRKEARQILDFVQKLHDREALLERESRRLFLAGEGFVAWPGPALRKFVDEFVVNNRLESGGFVIDGSTVSLSDVTCPVLAFVGLVDDIARPAAVRAIHEAAPGAPIYEAGVRAGHFGLVVGSRSLSVTWPTVVDWVDWLAAGAEPGARPEHVRGPGPVSEQADPESGDGHDEHSAGVELLYDVATDAIDAMWNRLGDASKSVTDLVDQMRWQTPRIAKLSSIEANDRIGIGRALAEQARAIPTQTFFLWQGRAFTYRDADARVTNVAKGLVHCGVKAGQRVGVLMEPRPSYLSIVAAVSRLGAVSVLFNAGGTKRALRSGLRLGGVDVLVTDPENAERGRDLFDGEVLVLGGGGDPRALIEGVVDMEAIDPDAVAWPSGFRPDAGRASDLAMILFTPGKGEKVRAARITNRRWAASALGAAATTSLTSRDTVYCCLPLSHAAGMLVSVGGALVGGSRLALGGTFSPARLWEEARRYGATVIFYAGDMCRALVDAPPSATDAQHPVRVFAGSGMRRDVWKRMVERFGVGVVEFYASTEGSCILVNASGAKVGSIGRPMPGSPAMRLVAHDFEERDFARDERGLCRKVPRGELGVLVARMDGERQGLGFDGYTDDKETQSRILRDVAEPDDTWFTTRDLIVKDRDGDYWYVDRLGEVVRTAHGPVPTREIEDALFPLAGVRRAVVYGLPLPGTDAEMLVATIETEGGKPLDPDALGAWVTEHLDPLTRPRFYRFTRSIQMTEGHRPRKTPLRKAGVGPDDKAPTHRYDDARRTCLPLDEAGWAAAIEQEGGSHQPS